MRHHQCSLIPCVLRFTFHILLSACAIGLPQALASSEMALIPAGSFQMGSDNGRSNEIPVHQVSVEAFYMINTRQPTQTIERLSWQIPDGTSLPSRHGTISGIGSETTFPLAWIGIR